VSVCECECLCIPIAYRLPKYEATSSTKVTEVYRQGVCVCVCVCVIVSVCVFMNSIKTAAQV